MNLTNKVSIALMLIGEFVDCVSLDFYIGIFKSSHNMSFDGNCLTYEDNKEQESKTPNFSFQAFGIFPGITKIVQGAWSLCKRGR